MSRIYDLPGVELIITPLLFHEILVASALYYLSGVKDHDAVRVPYRGEAVRDDKGGPALHEGVHALLHQALRIGDRGRFSVSPSTLKGPFPEGSEKILFDFAPREC